MQSKKVTITYYDEYGVWPHLADELSSRLPLRNLHWNPSVQRPLRTIQSLDVDMKRFTYDSAPQPLLSVQTPYLNLYFVACDDNDSYRMSVKKQIKAWMDVITTKKNQEWLLVYLAGQDTRKGASYLGLKTSVYDKIKNDFNVGKRDRCVYLRSASSEHADSEDWVDFINKMKDGIMMSFDAQVQQYQDDTRRLDLQRQMPGWNYCTFFILKEGLAHTFETMTLYEEALIQYDELEASFFQVLRDKALAWFGHVGGTSPGDDSSNVLDFKKKPYRELINKNTISVFDFRSYLFARQCFLLLKLQRPIETYARAQLFISNMTVTLKENDMPVEDYLESWIFSACTNIVNECEPVANHIGISNPEILPIYNAAKADLLILARKQLDKLGVKHSHLPDTTPFNMHSDKGANTKKRFSSGVEGAQKEPMTNQKLREAVVSRDVFDKMYMALSTRAIKGYDQSNRVRSALCAHGDIAAFKFAREKYDEAARILDSMTWRYGDQHWSYIENALLRKCAEAQKRLGNTRQFLECVLTLLKNASDLSSDEAEFYTNELLDNVQNMDEEIHRQFSPIFVVSDVVIVDDFETVDQTNIRITVDNKLPKALHFDNLSLNLVGNEPEHIVYEISDKTLNAGLNVFNLSSQTSAAGEYVVETCHVHFGKLSFSHNFLHEDHEKHILRLNHDMQKLFVDVEQPENVTLGEKQNFAVSIYSGNENIKEGTFSLASLTEGLDISLSSEYTATLKGTSSEMSQSIVLQTTESGQIKLPEMTADQVIEFLIPYDGPWNENQFRVQSKADYLTADGISRTFHAADFVDILIPLTVTESSIFGENCIYLKVEASCNGNIPARVLGSCLEPSSTYEIENQSVNENWDLTLFPRQVSTFVYKLKKQEGSAGSLQSKEHFVVKYRTLQSEVEAGIKAKLNTKLKEHNLGQHLNHIWKHVRKEFLSHIDYNDYGLTETVRVKYFDAEVCESFLLHRDLKTKVELLDLIEEFFEKNAIISQADIRKEQPGLLERTLSFPLDVPRSRVLHNVELILPNDTFMHVNEPCECTLRIKQSPYWASEETAKDVSSFFVYEIEADYDNWLLSGKRKLKFASKVGEVYEFPITLIALKTGQIPLPPVKVLSVLPSTFASTLYINSAQQILVRPKSRTATFFVEQQQRFVQQRTGAVQTPYSETNHQRGALGTVGEVVGS
ncbi:trafficking protein particle complex subunit 10 [Umbelopsis sp. PMI_123]|nr:trafficking protein particle complex subunit 10 [Umbelopsis sp. PMI_123]